MSSPMYGVGSNGGLTSVGSYDPKITEEVDRQIRNMPFIVDYCYAKAVELVKATGSDNFEVVLSTEHGGTVAHGGASSRGRMSKRIVFGRSQGSGGSHGTETQRPRAYVMPANNNGIHEELSEGVLLKAALGMTGK